MSPDVGGLVEIFDTTLRDGAQLEGISLTVDDKLRIAEQLDHLGIKWIEGGWPGANPKDEEFFRRAATELKLSTSTLVAFGSTRRVKGKVDDDPTLANLVAAGTSAVCIVGKSWDYHVTETLTTTLDEGVAMVADSVEYLRGHGLGVMFDAEHFFDGYKRNPEFALRVLEAAAENGASTLVLCDTNGGSLPFEVEQIVGDVVSHFRDDVIIAIHTHDDTGCAVANALSAVKAGARQVQGTINGIGERTGNCNLTTVIPNLTLKMGMQTIPPDRMERLTSVAHHIAELVNVAPNPQAPYVGSSAFAHKAGLHVERDRQAARRLRAHPPRQRRQRHPLRRIRARGQGDAEDQGRRARSRSGRQGARRCRRHVEAPRARGLPLRGGGRITRAADAACGRLGAAVLRGRVLPRHDRRAAERFVHH